MQVEVLDRSRAKSAAMCWWVEQDGQEGCGLWLLRGRHCLGAVAGVWKRRLWRWRGREDGACCCAEEREAVDL